MSGTRSILLVEDEEADRLSLVAALRGAAPGWTVTLAATGADGLQAMQDARFDCVLLDSRLPDMDAREFLECMHTPDSPRLPLPVAVLTREDDPDTASTALKLGAEDYVVKGTLNGAGVVRMIENTIEKFAIRLELDEKRSALHTRTRELERARDELQQRILELTEATAAKDQFVAVMSHEMRTPLNAILGYADLMDLGMGGDLPEGQRQNLERIRIGGQHLLELVNNVLDLSRADAGHADVELRTVDMVAVAEEVVALLESRADLGGIKLILDYPGEPLPPVCADLQRLRQVLTNIVGNAIKFTDEGHVRLCFTRRDDMIELTVEDTGIGIAAEHLPLVFSDFFQADPALTRRHGGSGLGLAIAQRFMRLMEGELLATSTIGEGSRFTIRLPIDREPGVAFSATSASAAPTAPHTNPARPTDASGTGASAMNREDVTDPRVVVVAFGRDAERLEQLRQQVRQHVRLVCSTDAAQVQDLVRKEEPSLVVLDLSGGDDAAWRAAQSLQDSPALMHTAVLLLPGIPAPSDSDEEMVGLDLGWVALVPKPFDATQLTSAVSRAARVVDDSMSNEAGAPIEVLIVDDDADSRSVAARFLTAAGAHAVEAAGGEDALARMREHAPDVLVLDLMMPVLDGFGVLATMRADPALAGIPVVVLSAKSLSEEERRFLSRAAVRVLQKGQHRLGDVAALVMRAAERAGT